MCSHLCGGEDVATESSASSDDCHIFTGECSKQGENGKRYLLWNHVSCQTTACRALGINGDQKIRRKLEKADKGSKVCKWVNSPAAHCLMSGWWAIHRWSPQTSKYQFQRSMYQSWAINDLPCPYIQKARVLVVRTPETATYFEFSPKKLDENVKNIKFALHWLLVLQPIVVSLKSCCVPSDPNPPWLYRAPPLVEEVS